MLMKINEEKLNQIITESIKKILTEEYYMSANNPEELGFLWDELASEYTTDNSQGNDTVFCDVAFYAIQKMCEKNSKEFGVNAKKLVDKYYTNSAFNQAFNKIVNNVRLQRM